MEAAAREERKRPLSREEVLDRLFPGMIAERINGLEVDDAEALRMQEFYPEWVEGIEYIVGFRVRYDGILYRCLQTHTAQVGWSPTEAPSIWAKVLIEDPDMIPEWEQPESTNGYMTGDRVTHNGTTWASILDNNIWEPGVYGWVEST